MVAFKRMHKLAVAALVLVAGAFGLGYYMTARGFSARDQPTFIEASVARTMRHLGVPRTARALTNPTPDTGDTIRAGMEHFSDHCAVCHANNGSGDTQIGRNLYPKAPDMRTAITQRLSDGELFYIIENGVRLTGMPAWAAGPEGENGSWALVRFIRHLPKVTDEEITEMEKLNPRSPGEMGISEEEFLKGTTPEPAPAAGAHGGHTAATSKSKGRGGRE